MLPVITPKRFRLARLLELENNPEALAVVENSHIAGAADFAPPAFTIAAQTSSDAKPAATQPASLLNRPARLCLSMLPVLFLQAMVVAWSSLLWHASLTCAPGDPSCAQPSDVVVFLSALLFVLWQIVFAEAFMRRVDRLYPNTCCEGDDASEYNEFNIGLAAVSLGSWSVMLVVSAATSISVLFQLWCNACLV